MKEIKRDNAIINCRILGKGDATLLFIHGSYINQSYWDEQVDYFSPHFTVATMDLPGHGLSGKERKNWSTEGFAEDVLAVIRQLNLKNVILVGHSWGADINLIAATKYPDSSIGFIAIDYYKNAATPAAPQEQVDKIKESLKKDFAAANENFARQVLFMPTTPKEIIDRVIKDYRNAYAPMGQMIMPEIFDLYKTEQELLPKLKHKLYLINVDYMPTNEKPLKQYCENGYELQSVSGTCHFPMLETPDELNKKLRHAIKEISAVKYSDSTIGDFKNST
jgi:sigma-B regulation protein RsbQ